MLTGKQLSFPQSVLKIIRLLAHSKVFHRCSSPGNSFIDLRDFTKRLSLVDLYGEISCLKLKKLQYCLVELLQ